MKRRNRIKEWRMFRMLKNQTFFSRLQFFLFPPDEIHYINGPETLPPPLTAEQEAVGTSLLEPSVGLLVALSDREGNGMLRKKRFDVCDELHHPFVVLLRVFTSLQYEGFEAELVSFLACLYDLFLCESVALYGCVGATDATVIAVVFAIVGYFNKGSYIYSFSELPNGSLCGLLSEPVLLLRVEL